MSQRDAREILRIAGLGSCADSIVAWGVEKPNDLMHLSKTDIDELGLNRIQARKLLALVESQRAGKGGRPQKRDSGASSSSSAPATSLTTSSRAQPPTSLSSSSRAPPTSLSSSSRAPTASLSGSSTSPVEDAIKFEVEGVRYVAKIKCPAEDGRTFQLQYLCGADGDEWVQLDQGRQLLCDAYGHIDVPYQLVKAAESSITTIPIAEQDAIQFEVGGIKYIAKIIAHRASADGMTDLIEYLFGGDGEEWVHLDERSQLLTDAYGNRNVPYQPMKGSDNAAAYNPTEAKLAAAWLPQAQASVSLDSEDAVIQFELGGRAYVARVVERRSPDASGGLADHIEYLNQGGGKELVHLDEQNMTLRDAYGHCIPFQVTQGLDTYTDEFNKSENGGTGSLEKEVDDALDVKQSERLRVPCWACGSSIQMTTEDVPPWAAAEDVEFVCRGCEAHNQPRYVQHGQLSPKNSEDGADTCGRSFFRKTVGLFFLVIVPSVVLGAFVVYIFFLLPVLYPGLAETPVEWAPGAVALLIVAVWFEFHILWNLGATVWRLPGSPAWGVEYGTKAAAANRRLAGFSLCRCCGVPRPPRTYHCWVCVVCVHDLDCHCLLLNTCVGFANRRNFVLLCAYATMGCSFVLLTMSVVAHSSPSELIRTIFPECISPNVESMYTFIIQEPPMLSSGSAIPLGPLQDCVSSTGASAVIFLWALSVIVVCGVGWKLCNMIYVLAHGTTMLEGPNSDSMLASAKTWREWHALACANAYAVVGSPGSWLLPRCGPWPHELGGLAPPVEVDSSCVDVERTNIMSNGLASKKVQ